MTVRVMCKRKIVLYLAIIEQDIIILAKLSLTVPFIGAQ